MAKKEKKKTKAKEETENKKVKDDDLFLDEEDGDENAIIANLKKDLLKRGKEKGSLDQGEIMDLTSKYDLSEENYENLIDFFQNSGIKIINDDEEEEASLDDADVGEIDLEKQNQEMEADEELSDENSEKEEVEAIDDFSKLQSGEVKVNDSVKMYLKEIGKVNLLNAKEETELAKQIAIGEEAMKKLHDFHDQYVKGGGKDDFDTWYKAIRFNYPTKEIFLTKCTVDDGQNAKNKLITANLRLVISIAKHYVGRGMHFLDLIQEGNMGLIKAVEKFDYTKGFKFSTYATWWIRQAITRAIADQARTIRIPVHMVETINKMTRFQRQLVQEYGREPTAEEISAKMDGALSPERIREIQRIAMEPVSLETPIGEEDDSHLGDFIEDKEAQSPEEYTTKSLLRDELYEIMNDLTDRERKVLHLRYGLDNNRTMTLEEVGKEFNVTRERIRQIESKAIRKLRHPTRAKKLGDYRDTFTMNGPDTSKK